MYKVDPPVTAIQSLVTHCGWVGGYRSACLRSPRIMPSCSYCGWI